MTGYRAASSMSDAILRSSPASSGKREPRVLDSAWRSRARDFGCGSSKETTDERHFTPINDLRLLIRDLQSRIYVERRSPVASL